ncbi:hypothetical protein [uncultured Roseobacter sp.]|uniref:hypothetical protein n=1 Tax=uncultured Roseobacter sp. TaxID=114847 RepID=UPI00261CE72E|nr:hypothetical protein [uncultured Roseobacter sp.]
MNQTIDLAPITVAFEAHDIDNAAFDHTDHVRVAFDLLAKYDFIDASAIYAKGIRTLAAKAGAPKKFNLTITYAFMSLIAERLANCPSRDFDAFVRSNTDLMSKDVLMKWYDSARLHADAAHEIFLLPDVA